MLAGWNRHISKIYITYKNICILKILINKTIYVDLCWIKYSIITQL